MKINSQIVQDLDTHLQLKLRDPWWGAWERFGWKEGVEGFGINLEILQKAIDTGKKILFKYDYGDYEITPTKAKKHADKWSSYYTARNGTLLAVVPRTSCKRIDPEDLGATYDSWYNARKKLADEFRNREKTRGTKGKMENGQ